MKTVKEITQETVDAFIETMSLTIFYEKVADELQMTAPEGYGFDCRKISISNKIQEQWIQQFEEKLGKEQSSGIVQNTLTCWTKGGTSTESKRNSY